MVELDNMKNTLSTYEKPLEEIRNSLDLDNKEKRIAELDRMMEEPGFWDNPEESTKIVRENRSLKNTMERFQKLESSFSDIGDMIELGNEEEDEGMIPEIREMLDEFIHELEELKSETLLTGEYDANNAILRLNAGAGGTESSDWCSMLYRMYTRWAERQGYSVEVLDFLDGDVAGIKSVTIQINGENAYGRLRSEHGVHRLVRISPFNAAGKRQTSFVSCDVMPELSNDIHVEINPDDIRVDTYRSSGAGGQHINKTSSAIRITHLPTGIVVTCQNERSQFQNKDKAMQMLEAKLYMLEQQKQADAADEIRGTVKEIGWGSQIRSYVLQPYTMVKDLRSGYTTGNVTAVLDGDLNDFITAYLTWQSLGGDLNDFITAYLTWQSLGCPQMKGVDAD